MKNFEYYNPVRILFGKGTIASIDTHIAPDARILLCYGGGSIHKNGVYQQVIEALGDRTIVEFGGIMPNPEMEYLLPAVDIIRKEKLNFILAVGGGSVVDGVKFIAAAVEYTGDDPWDILSKNAPVERALPFGAVLTLPATGTEMNGNSVITKASTLEKFAFGSPAVFPQFSVLDPETTYSLPERQVANGIIDAFVHVMEQYLTYPVQARVQDAFAESLLLILKKEGPKALCGDAPDYDNRANIMWAATNALNTQLSMGVISDQAVGHSSFDFVLEDDLDDTLSSLGALGTGREKVFFENRVRTTKGIQWFGWDATLIPLESGDEIQIVGRNITKQRNYLHAIENERKKAEKASEAKSRFVSKVSHELRTPLNSIIGFSDLLSKEDLPSKSRSRVKSILNSSVHLKSMINDLLDFTKIESDTVTIASTVFQIRPMVRDLMNSFQVVLANGVDLSIEVSRSFPASIRFDKTKLWQILNNLIGN